MFTQHNIYWFALLVLAPGCLYEGDESSPDVSVAQLPDKPFFDLPNTDAPVEVVRPTADGELVRAEYPQLAPTAEVPAGSVCGVQDHTGTLLSCQPGTFCNQPSPDAPATCVRAPTAPVWER